MTNSPLLAKARAQQQLFGMVQALKLSSQKLMDSLDVLATVHTLDKTNAEHRKIVQEAIDVVDQFYRLQRGAQNQNYSEDFYKSPEGLLLSGAQVWYMGSDLVSLQDGAVILFVVDKFEKLHSRQRVRMSSYVNDVPPKLTLYYDEHAPYKKRVSMREILELKPKIR